jgi:transposase
MHCGIDWAENHHDVALVDGDGELRCRERITDDAAGLGRLLELLAEHGDSAEAPIPVAIETNRGLLVAALHATGRLVFAINPLAVSRYRDRYGVSGNKSDHGDAVVLANILRTDRAAHRPMPVDSELAQAISVLARAQQDAVWARVDAHNRLRSVLREFYPGFLAAFAGKRGGIMRSEARLILAAAPTPARAAQLTMCRLKALLRRAGRVRSLDVEAQRIQDAFRTASLHHPIVVEDAFGRQTLALLRILDAACTNADELEQATIEAFNQHPDAATITSFPGLGGLTGARILGEIGDDRSRFTDVRGLKAYAGAAPVTRASGKSHVVTARRIKNNRLADAGYAWAFSALTASTGARAHYERRRARNDRHPAAQRHLFNRLLGGLYHCLQTGQIYDEAKAFPPMFAADA